MGTSRQNAQRDRTVFERDGYRCVYCGRIFDAPLLTVDHVQPRVKGGDNSLGNLVTACAPCNTRKGGRAAWDWLSARPVERENFLRYAQRVWPRLIRAVEEAALQPDDPPPEL